MLLSYEDLSPVRKSVEVEIPADLINAEAQRVTTEFGRQAKIPGFRPGKIPAGVVRKHFAKEIQQEILDRLLPRTFRDAIADKGVIPVGEPHLEHLDAFVEGAPIKYKAAFDIKPTVNLGEYRGLELEDPKIDVTVDDVQTMIERLRDQASAYRPETERGLQDGDFAVIEITTSGEGVEPETRGGHFRMGEEMPLAELPQALFGRKPGDVASFDHAYGDDAQNEAFRGKTIKHDVTLKEIRVQEKPEVTDEFAQSTGSWETVDQMRTAIEADIRRHRELETLRMKRGQIGDKLLAGHELEVPESLVHEELGKSLQNYARFLATQGVDIDKAELDWEKIAADSRPEAVKRVKRGLILEEIAKKEGLTISDVEVDAEIRKAANENGRDFAEVKHRLKHDGGYEGLRASLGQEKALDFVLREARTK
jgi:trigger factor